MNDTFLLTKGNKAMIKVIFGIIGSNPLNANTKLIFYHGEKKR